MKHKLILLLILIFSLISACRKAAPAAVPTGTSQLPTASATADATSTLTVTPSPVPTATRKPTAIKSKTITPTPTATVPVIKVGGNPVGLGTALPDVEPISLDNIDRLEEIGYWGYGSLYDVKLSPDESQVAAATSKGVFWFNADTLDEEEFVFYQQNCNALKVELSYSTGMAACIDQNNRDLFLFNTSDGSIIDRLVQQQEYLSDLWFSPDDSALIVAGNQLTYQWNFHEHQWSLMDVEDIKYIDFSQDGSSYVFLSNDQEPFYYSATTGKTALWKAIDFNEPLGWDSIDLSVDGRFVALGNGWEQSVMVWDIEKEQSIFYRCVDPDGCWLSDEDTRLSSSKALSRPILSGGPSGWISTVRLSPDNKYLLFEAYGDGTSKLYIYNLATGIFMKTMDNAPGEIVLYSDNRRYLMWSDEITLFRFYKEDFVATTTVLFNMTAEVFSPANDFIASIVNEEIQLRNIQNGNLEYRFVFPRPLTGVSFFHHDSKILVTLRGDFQDVHIWNYETNQIQRIKEEPNEVGLLQWYVKAMFPAVSFDDRYIYFQIYDYYGFFYDLEKGNHRAEDHLVGWSFHPNRDQALTTWDSDILFFNLDDGLDIKFVTPDMEWCVSTIRDSYPSWGYLPSGSGLFCSITGMLKLYDNDGRETQTLVGWYAVPYPWGPVSLAITPDDSIVFGYEQNFVYIYDLIEEQPLYSFPIPANVESMLVSPDGKYLAISGSDGILHIYGIPVTDNE